MESMNQEELENLVSKLDSEIAKTGAQVRIEQYGGGPEETRVIATRSGYLRLGVEMMKAGLSPDRPGKSPGLIDVDIDYLLAGSEVQIDWWERPDSIPTEPASEPSRLIGVLILGLLISAAVLAIIGLFTVLRWFTA